MALNKYMHPRNIYKTPPDFAKLAKSDMEFARIVKTDVTGKVSLDFKDPHALRVLTKSLLKSDFGLNVVIPEDRLVPTLPLRLNYILWIEDLLHSVHRNDNIRGLDIGTGACAIYPLLAAVKNKWHMVGTESDQGSVLKAKENVDRNNLQNFIQVSKNPTKSLMEYLLADEAVQKFDFCMCNPPFYSSVQELCDSRSPARLPPKNGFTGSPQELITEGGELAFCRRMIDESKMFKDKVLIFTTMVGHKFNLKELMQDMEAEGIQHTTTEFCQGRVTRWGLAWTYQEFEISKLVPGRDKPRKKNVPILYQLPKLKDDNFNVEAASKKILAILRDLKIEVKILNKRGNNISLNILAIENTWSNQRRKKRQMRQIHETEAKKLKLDKGVDDLDGDPTNSKNNGSEVDDIRNSEPKKNEEGISNSKDNEVEDKEKFNTASTSTSVLEVKLENSTNHFKNHEALVHAFLKIFMRDDDVYLEMEFLNGTSGKEGLHQIMQYIKNHWK